MSTKIYNGYISHLPINELLPLFKKEVETFEKIKEEQYYKYLAKSVVFQIDEKVVGKKNSEELFNQIEISSLVYDQHDEAKEKVNKNIPFNIREVDLDFTANCVVIPLDNKTLILFYCENIYVLNHWDNLDYIKDYHYQNQTDKPNHISKNKWDKRKKDWDNALKDGVPMHCGYTFTFTTMELPYPDLLTLNKFIPSHEQRAKHLIKHKHLVTDAKSLNKKKRGLNSDMTAYFNILDKYLMYEKTEQYKKDVLQKQSKLPIIDFDK